jgi:uroporphyrinogen decarboxylase
MVNQGALNPDVSILTRRERTRRAVNYEPVDRLPTQVNYTEAVGRKLAAHLGVAMSELHSRLDNHLLRLDLSYPARFSDDGTVAYDHWGVGFSTQQEGYQIAVHPLASPGDLDAFDWPDPGNPSILDKARQLVHQDNGQHFLTCNLGFCLFERAWALRGLEAFLMDLVLDPAVAEELLERITVIQVGFVKRLLTLGLDAGYFGDDYGAQKGTLFSPTLWRRLFKPRLARLFTPFREAGLPVILHSDGDICDILPDLVDIGVTVLNPAQPEVLDHTWLRRTFGHRLAYYGGVSTQTVLSQGGPDKVRFAVRQCVRQLAPEGTGLLLGPAHRLMSDVPVENVDALLDALGAEGGTE